MADVTIPRADLTAVPRSGACVDCGAAADRTRPGEFAWTPSWALFCWALGLLPGAVAVLLTRKRVAIDLPVCPHHAAGGRAGLGMVWALLAGGLLVGAAGAVLPNDPAGIGDGMLLGGVGLMVLAGLAAMALGGRGVRAAWITDRARSPGRSRRGRPPR
jgi:hypothetical protein